MPKRKILITGGAGNIGGSLARKLVEDSDNFVLIVDNLSTGSREKLPSASYGNWKFIKADVNRYDDTASIMMSHQFDYVFHYAAVVGVQRTLANPICVLGDIDGIRNVLSLSKNVGIKRIFYSSSSEVYGEPVEVPQREATTPLNSRLPYAIVKNVGEAFLRAYAQEHGLQYSIFRFFNTYGPNQSDDFVISRFLRQALLGEPITVYGDGKQTRTFCYIDDNIRATTRCLYEERYVNETVNIGSDEEISIVNLAKKIKAITGSKSVIQHVAALEEGDMRRRCPCVEKMLGLVDGSLIGLDEGIQRTATSPYFVQQQDGYANGNENGVHQQQHVLLH